MIILLGKPGSGKGTQADLLVKQDRFVAISAGALLRKAATHDPAIAAMQKAGQLADVSLMGGLMARAIESVQGKRIILDGFPRTREQASWLKDYLATHPKSSVTVFLLEIPDNEVFARLAERGRVDDTPETIAHRLELYHREAEQITELIQGFGEVHRIDGHGSIEDVHARIAKLVDKTEKE